MKSDPSTHLLALLPVQNHHVQQLGLRRQVLLLDDDGRGRSLEGGCGLLLRRRGVDDDKHGVGLRVDPAAVVLPRSLRSCRHVGSRTRTSCPASVGSEREEGGEGGGVSDVGEVNGRRVTLRGSGQVLQRQRHVIRTNG